MIRRMDAPHETGSANENKGVSRIDDPTIKMDHLVGVFEPLS